VQPAKLEQELKAVPVHLEWSGKYNTATRLACVPVQPAKLEQELKAVPVHLDWSDKSEYNLYCNSAGLCLVQPAKLEQALKAVPVHLDWSGKFNLYCNTAGLCSSAACQAGTGTQGGSCPFGLVR
jgi:hypothetical protein